MTGPGRRAALAAAALAAAGCTAPQRTVLTNLPAMLSYEKVYDRYAQVDETQTDVSARVAADGREAAVVSAFFGLDDALPSGSRLVLCDGADGADGLPVVFSHEVDPDSVEPGDFRLVTASGVQGEVACLTLSPADDPGELRTALLAGAFGDAGDQPVTVEIVGHVLTMDGSATFRGARAPVVPLEDGPTLVWAEIVPEDRWTLGAPGTRLPWGGGTSCPVGTEQIVRVAWNGGITLPGGGHLTPEDAAFYAVEVATPEGGTTTVAPMALADLSDGDNNHALCLDTRRPAVLVSIAAGRVTDPADDPNPATEIAVPGAD
ncbi:MAG: hypothetical protein AAFU61_00950 [Pseudomonadota bacterium]